MILDQQSLFSDAQAITVSANSSNVIESMGASVVPGAPVTSIGCFGQVNQAFAGGTSLQIQVVSADDAALTTNVVVHVQTQPLAPAALSQGALPLATRLPPQKIRRYLGLRYVVVGTMTAGAITAGLVEDLNSVLRSTDFNKGFSVA